MADTSHDAGRQDRRKAAGFVGWSVYGLFGLGLVSPVVGLAALFEEDYQGAGLCLIASALGFGLLFNGVLRR